MDYYRRYTGDYLKKTLRLSMTEDGAYTRLLDHYYTEEGPLPAVLDEVYKIARATKTHEREAVRTVLEKHFELREGGYHNDRADEELGIAVPKIEKLRETARQNGKKGGRPKKPKPVPAENQIGLSEKTNSGCGQNETAASADAISDAKRPQFCDEKTTDPTRKSKPITGAEISESPLPTRACESYPKPDLVSTRASQATVNRQPSTKPNTSDHRFPGDGDITDPSPKAVNSDPHEKPVHLDRVLEECRRARLMDPTEANAVVMRWLRHGATPSIMVNAMAEARRTRPAPAELAAGYVDPIVERLLKAERDTQANAKAIVERTSAIIAESRAADDRKAPMPSHVRAQLKRKPEPIPE